MIMMLLESYPTWILIKFLDFIRQENTHTQRVKNFLRWVSGTLQNDTWALIASAGKLGTGQFPLQAPFCIAKGEFPDIEAASFYVSSASGMKCGFDRRGLF